MRVLLDEQLPRQLAPLLIGHEVRTVRQQEWAGPKNGELLTKAEAAAFFVFVTGDQSLQFQQNLSAHVGCCRALCGRNALEDLEPLIQAALAAIADVRPGQVIRVSP